MKQQGTNPSPNKQKPQDQLSLTEPKKIPAPGFKNSPNILGTIYKSSENAVTAEKELGKKIQPLLIVNKLNNTLGGANFDLDDVASTNNNQQ
jgi:hypothetical protein